MRDDRAAPPRVLSTAGGTSVLLQLSWGKMGCDAHVSAASAVIRGRLESSAATDGVHQSAGAA